MPVTLTPFVKTLRHPTSARANPALKETGLIVKVFLYFCDLFNFLYLLLSLLHSGVLLVPVSLKLFFVLNKGLKSQLGLTHD